MLDSDSRPVEDDAKGAYTHYHGVVLIAVEPASGNPYSVPEGSFFDNLMQDFPVFGIIGSKTETGVDPDDVELVFRCLYDEGSGLGLLPVTGCQDSVFSRHLIGTLPVIDGFAVADGLLERQEIITHFHAR